MVRLKKILSLLGWFDLWVPAWFGGPQDGTHAINLVERGDQVRYACVDVHRVRRGSVNHSPAVNRDGDW